MSGVTQNNYALAAKIHAMHGRSLTPQNYRELLRKQSIPEAAAYLKQQTSYSDLLGDVNENLIHRGQLESILRRKVFEEYVRTFHYVEPRDREFYEYVITQMEIDEILSVIRLINAGRQGDYIFSVPTFLARRSSFDLYHLAKVSSYQDLVDFLAGTPYQALLQKYPPGPDGRINPLRVEIEFMHYFYGRVFGMIRRLYKGSTRSELMRSFGTDVDLKNLMFILRLKRYFNAPPEFIRSVLLPYYYRVSREELERILMEPDVEAVQKAIFTTHYGESFQKHKFDYLERYEQQVEYEYHRLLLSRATTAPALLVSYMHLENIELSNLVNIIEGIRYALPPAEIAKLLIGTEA